MPLLRQVWEYELRAAAAAGWDHMLLRVAAPCALVLAYHRAPTRFLSTCRPVRVLAGFGLLALLGADPAPPPSAAASCSASSSASYCSFPSASSKLAAVAGAQQQQSMPPPPPPLPPEPQGWEGLPGLFEIPLLGGDPWAPHVRALLCLAGILCATGSLTEWLRGPVLQRAFGISARVTQGTGRLGHESVFYLGMLLRTSLGLMVVVALLVLAGSPFPDVSARGTTAIGKESSSGPGSVLSWWPSPRYILCGHATCGVLEQSPKSSSGLSGFGLQKSDEDRLRLLMTLWCTLLVVLCPAQMVGGGSGRAVDGNGAARVAALPLSCCCGCLRCFADNVGSAAVDCDDSLWWFLPESLRTLLTLTLLGPAPPSQMLESRGHTDHQDFAPVGEICRQLFSGNQGHATENGLRASVEFWSRLLITEVRGRESDTAGGGPPLALFLDPLIFREVNPLTGSARSRDTDSGEHDVIDKSVGPKIAENNAQENSDCSDAQQQARQAAQVWRQQAPRHPPQAAQRLAAGERPDTQPEQERDDRRAQLPPEEARDPVHPAQERVTCGLGHHRKDRLTHAERPQGQEDPEGGARKCHGFTPRQSRRPVNLHRRS